MTNPSAVVLLAAGLAGCSLYAPTFRDCSVHCGEGDGCPAGTVCQETFCRPTGFAGACDCSLGDSQPCGGGRGECKAGVRLCLDTGSWGPCLGEQRPSTELCDAKDNDCDGASDEDILDAPSCPLTSGVCAATTQRCLDGGFVVDACASSYGVSYQQQELSCDALDNDCDGLTDATSPTIVASNVAQWTAVGVTDGYFVFTTSPSGTTVAAQRLDAQLQPMGSPVSVDVGAAVSFTGRAGNGATAVVGFQRPDLSTGVLRVTTGAPTPVQLEGSALGKPVDWAVSVLEDGRAQAAVIQDGGVVFFTWAPATTTATVTGYTPRQGLRLVDHVTLTEDGTVLGYDGLDALVGAGATRMGVDALDGGPTNGVTFIIFNPFRVRYGRMTLVEVGGVLQSVAEYSSSFESTALACFDLWRSTQDCPAVAREPDSLGIREVTATRVGADLVSGWVQGDALLIGTLLPSVQQVRARRLTPGAIAELELASPRGGPMLAVFFRLQSDLSKVYAMGLCAP